MSTELAKFDALSLKDRVTERIKSSFVDLIPEEQWKAMVAAELKKFTENPRDMYGPEKPSQLEIMIREEIVARIRKSIREELDKPEYQGYVGHGSSSISAIAKEITSQAGADLLKSITQELVQLSISNLRNSLAQRPSY